MVCVSLSYTMYYIMPGVSDQYPRFSRNHTNEGYYAGTDGWDRAGMMKIKTMGIVWAATLGVLALPQMAAADHLPKMPEPKSACSVDEQGGTRFSGPEGHVYMICERSDFDGAFRWHTEDMSSRGACHPSNPYRRADVCDVPNLDHIKPGTPIYVDPSVNQMDWIVVNRLRSILQGLDDVTWW